MKYTIIQSIKKKKPCPRGDQCAFYHSVEEKRDSSKIIIPPKLVPQEHHTGPSSLHSFHVPYEYYETPYEDVRSSVKTTHSEYYDNGNQRSFGPMFSSPPQYNSVASSFVTMEEKMKLVSKLAFCAPKPNQLQTENPLEDPIWKYTKEDEEEMSKDPKIQYALDSLDS